MQASRRRSISRTSRLPASSSRPGGNAGGGHSGVSPRERHAEAGWGEPYGRVVSASSRDGGRLLDVHERCIECENQPPKSVPIPLPDLPGRRATKAVVQPALEPQFPPRLVLDEAEQCELHDGVVRIAARTVDVGNDDAVPTHVRDVFACLAERETRRMLDGSEGRGLWDILFEFFGREKALAIAAQIGQREYGDD